MVKGHYLYRSIKVHHGCTLAHEIKKTVRPRWVLLQIISRSGLNPCCERYFYSRFTKYRGCHNFSSLLVFVLALFKPCGWLLRFMKVCQNIKPLLKPGWRKVLHYKCTEICAAVQTTGPSKVYVPQVSTNTQ